MLRQSIITFNRSAGFRAIRVKSTFNERVKQDASGINMKIGKNLAGQMDTAQHTFENVKSKFTGAKQDLSDKTENAKADAKAKKGKMESDFHDADMKLGRDAANKIENIESKKADTREKIRTDFNNEDMKLGKDLASQIDREEAKHAKHKSEWNSEKANIKSKADQVKAKGESDFKNVEEKADRLWNGPNGSN